MTEQDIKNLLGRIDELYSPRKIGSTGTTWIIVGHPRENYSLKDVEKKLKSEPYNVSVTGHDGEIRLKVEEDEKIILKLPQIPPINIVLFLLTGITTLVAGTLMAGGNPIENPGDISLGISFSVTLLLILGFHESGHYYFARKHKVDATLPYFIPAPTLIGTFGAFIKIKSPIYSRKALLQIGAAGPIAGFVIAVPALIIGLIKSQVMEVGNDLVGLSLGDSLLMKMLIAVIHPGLGPQQDIFLHPIAFAGWIGLLVTMLNLLPVGQLDGGHIAYALLGEKQNKIAWGVLAALIPLSLISFNWLVWGILILVLSRTAKHPPIMDIHIPLTRNDKVIGLVTLIIFILCFIPAPFKG